MADILFEGDPSEAPKPRGRQHGKILFEGNPYDDPKKGMRVQPGGRRDVQTLFNGPVEKASGVPGISQEAVVPASVPDESKGKPPRQFAPERHNTSDVYYHTGGRSSGRSLRSTLGIIGIVVMGLIFLYWILATKNGANNFWGKVNAIVAPTGKILSSKPMFTKGTSQLFSNRGIAPQGSTTTGSSMPFTPILIA